MIIFIRGKKEITLSTLTNWEQRYASTEECKHHSVLLFSKPFGDQRLREGIMGFEIAEEIRNQTTRCPFDFECLEAGETQVCPVDQYLKGNGLFLRQNKRVHCPYLMTFGQKYICNCPTHVDLHQQYNI